MNWSWVSRVDWVWLCGSLALWAWLAEYYISERKHRRKQRERDGEPDKPARVPFHLVGRSRLLVGKDGEKLGHVSHLNGDEPVIPVGSHLGKDLGDAGVHSISPNAGLDRQKEAR